MKASRLLPFLLFPTLALAGDGVLFTMETYSLPAATWLKIPTTMRDDPALLRKTLIGQLPKGSVILRDRTGGSCRSGQKNLFETFDEILVPTKFEANDTAIYPLEWKPRQLGSSLKLVPNFSRSANLDYLLTAPDPPVVPVLQTGKRLDLERANLPVLSTMHLDGTVPIAPISLAAIAPDPDRRLREQRLLLCFLVANGLPDDDEAANREPAYTIELLGLRGSTVTSESPAPDLMKNLLRRTNAHAFTIGTTLTPGRRASLDAVQEIPYPSRAEKGPGGVVPTSIDSISVGTVLSAQFSPLVDNKVSVIIQINHDWRDPILPAVPGKGEELMQNSRIPYTMQLRARTEIEPGAWTLLAQRPLSELFGPDDRDTRGESCYLFGRIVTGK